MQRSSTTGAQLNARRVAWLGVMTGLAAALMYVEVMLPLFPEFLKYDLGDFPALIVGFALGPMPGVMVEIGKEILFMLMHGGTPIGVTANLVAGTVWVLTASLVYWRWRTKRGAVAALVAGGATMTAVMAVGNAFVFLPLWGIPAAAIPTMIWTAILPFNLVKVTATGLVTFALYKRVRVVFLERFGLVAERVGTRREPVGGTGQGTL